MEKGKRKLIIIGASGHGKVITDLALKNNYEIIGYLDDECSLKRIMDIPVLGKVCDIEQYKDTCEFIIAIGNNLIRERIAKKYNVKWATLIHPRATIGVNVHIGEGTVVMANAVVNTCSIIGRHCIVNTGAIVEHDNVINDYVHISPNAALGGAVKVGKRVHVGIGGNIKNNIEVSQDVLLGAGAVLVTDIKIPGTYVGVPAKIKI